MVNIEGQVREIEARTGRFVITADLVNGKVIPTCFASYGPGDLVVNVWNCRAQLCVAKADTSFDPVPEPEGGWPEAVLDWIDQNLAATGGAINLSGIYPVALPVPDEVKRMLPR